jgi:hypothetical protein
MRVIILLFFCGYIAHADTVTNSYDNYTFDTYTNSSPKLFNSGAELEKWANSTCCGYEKTVLWYKKHELVIYFRIYTSGVISYEPFVFVEKNGRWMRVLTAMDCGFLMEATIEGDTLVIWRLDWPEGKKKKTEFLRFDLRNLDAG